MDNSNAPMKSVKLTWKFAGNYYFGSIPNYVFVDPNTNVDTDPTKGVRKLFIDKKTLYVGVSSNIDSNRTSILPLQKITQDGSEISYKNKENNITAIFDDNSGTIKVSLPSPEIRIAVTEETTSAKGSHLKFFKDKEITLRYNAAESSERQDVFSAPSMPTGFQQGLDSQRVIFSEKTLQLTLSFGVFKKVFDSSYFFIQDASDTVIFRLKKRIPFIDWMEGSVDNKNGFVYVHIEPSVNSWTGVSLAYTSGAEAPSAPHKFALGQEEKNPLNPNNYKKLKSFIISALSSTPTLPIIFSKGKETLTITDVKKLVLSKVDDTETAAHKFTKLLLKDKDNVQNSQKIPAVSLDFDVFPVSDSTAVKVPECLRSYISSESLRSTKDFSVNIKDTIETAATSNNYLSQYCYLRAANAVKKAFDKKTPLHFSGSESASPQDFYMDLQREWAKFLNLSSLSDYVPEDIAVDANESVSSTSYNYLREGAEVSPEIFFPYLSKFNADGNKSLVYKSLLTLLGSPMSSGKHSYKPISITGEDKEKDLNILRKEMRRVYGLKDDADVQTRSDFFQQLLNAEMDIYLHEEFYKGNTLNEQAEDIKDLTKDTAQYLYEDYFPLFSKLNKLIFSVLKLEGSYEELLVSYIDTYLDTESPRATTKGMTNYDIIEFLRLLYGGNYIKTKVPQEGGKGTKTVLKYKNSYEYSLEVTFKKVLQLVKNEIKTFVDTSDVRLPDGIDSDAFSERVALLIQKVKSLPKAIKVDQALTLLFGQQSGKPLASDHLLIAYDFETSKLVSPVVYLQETTNGQTSKFLGKDVDKPEVKNKLIQVLLKLEEAMANDSVSTEGKK